MMQKDQDKEKKTAAGSAPENRESSAPADTPKKGQAAKTSAADKQAEDAAAKADELAGKLGEAEAELERTKEELAAAKDTLLRTAADYDNFRKRTAREKDSVFGNGVGFALTEFLPVIDSLELAADAETTDENYKKGVVMTLTKSGDALRKMGVTEIEALGKPFDPEKHNALMQEPATDKAPAGTVTKVLAKGYQLDGKIIRHASVAIAAGK